MSLICAKDNEALANPGYTYFCIKINSPLKMLQYFIIFGIFIVSYNLFLQCLEYALIVALRLQIKVT